MMNKEEKHDVTTHNEDDVGHRPTLHVADKTTLSGRMKFAMAVTYIACCNFGFQAAIIGSTLGQPAFFEAFPEAGTNSNITGAVVCMTNAGGAFGVVVIALLSNWLGRKPGFAIAASLTILGAALAAGAQNLTMLCFGRMFVGFGGWASIMVSVAYVQELSPTHARGHIGGGVGPALNFGYILANWIQVGLYYYTDPFSWRLAQLLQIVLPILVLCGLPFMPESPRWLIYKGRPQKALGLFESLHFDPNDPDHVIARMEYMQVTKQVALDKQHDSSWLNMFIKYRKRTLSAMLITTVNQLCGPQVITSYVTIYEAAGMTGGTPLILQASWNIWGWTCSFIWLQFINKFGRKKMLQFGVGGTLIAFVFITALYAEYVEKGATHASPEAGRGALIAFFFIWLIPYELAEPAMFAYIGEIFPTSVRVKGVALGLVGITVTSAWLTMAFPVGVTNVGWKFFLLPICCMAAGLVLQQLLVRESRNIPLEEMAAVWGEAEDVAVISAEITMQDLYRFEKEDEVASARHSQKS